MSADLIRGVAERLMESIRQHTPRALLPLVVRVRFHLAWSRGGVRDNAHRQMEFLLGQTRPGADLTGAARGYVKQMIWRGEVRWHPDLVTSRRVEGIEHLIDARGLGRGVILSFMHHGFYDSAFPAIALAGAPPHMLMYPYMARDDAPRWIKQHVRVNSIGGGIPTSTDIGPQGILDLLAGGEIVAIASDVPGRTPVTFAGRRLLGSFGAARIALQAGSPLVLMTSERDQRGPHVRLHEALHPGDFDSPQSLLEEILSRHEKQVLAWPEATDLPLSRWGSPEPVESR